MADVMRIGAVIVNVVDADCVLHLNGLYRIIDGDGCGFDTGIPYSQQNLCHSLQSVDGNLDFEGEFCLYFCFLLGRYIRSCKWRESLL